MEWQLQEAKSRFSAFVKMATRAGPQVVTVRGKASAVLLSKDDYDRLTRNNRQDSLVEFLRQSPLADHSESLDLTRDKDTGRDIGL